MRETIFEYKIDYKGARSEAEKLAKEILKKYPQVGYRIVTILEEGVYIELYGDNEEFIHKISESLNEKKVELLVAGMPVYVIYGGREQERIGI